MKTLHILPILLLSALLCSCSGQKVIQTKLAQSDSLMVSSPDSSYSILKSIDNTRLYSKALKAKYALLYTEAQYKNYEELESDSLINVAVNYYEKKGERRDYGRSLMYKGAVLYDMMDYNGAIEEYKRAEEVLEPLDEYLLLGLINTRIAEVYGHIYEDRNIVLEKDKKAANYYQKTKDVEREINAYTYIGESYVILSEKDSALFYIGKSFNYSLRNNDTVTLLHNYYLLSSLFLRIGDFQQAKKICLDAVNQYWNSDINSLLYNLTSSYAHLKQIDSAYFYFEKIYNKNNLLSDYIAMSEIAECAGNYKQAFLYDREAQSIADSIQQVRKRQQALQIEKRYDYQKFALQTQIIKSRQEIQLILTLSAICVCILIILILIMLVGRNRRIISGKIAFIEQLKNEADVTKNKFLDELSKKNETEVQLKKILGDKLSILKEMASISYEYGGKADSGILVREYNKIMKVGKLGEGVFKDILEIVNVQCKGIIEHIQMEHPELNDDDIYFICLLYCGFTPSAICAFFGYKTQYVVYVRKSRLSKKMNLRIPIDEYILETAKRIKRDINNVNN